MTLNPAAESRSMMIDTTTSASATVLSRRRRRSISKLPLLAMTMITILVLRSLFYDHTVQQRFGKNYHFSTVILPINNSSYYDGFVENNDDGISFAAVKNRTYPYNNNNNNNNNNSSQVKNSGNGKNDILPNNNHQGSNKSTRNIINNNSDNNNNNSDNTNNNNNNNNNNTKKKPHLIIHIGPPKTGTTTLQHAFVEMDRLGIFQQDSYRYSKDLMVGKDIGIFLNEKCQKQLNQVRRRLFVDGHQQQEQAMHTKMYTNSSSASTATATTTTTYSFNNNNNNNSFLLLLEESLRAVPCWNRTLEALKPYSQNGTNIFFSSEPIAFYKNQLWQKIMLDWESVILTLMKDWNFKIIIGYRRYPEWFYSGHQQYYRYRPMKRLVNKWPNRNKIVQQKGQQPTNTTATNTTTTTTTNTTSISDKEGAATQPPPPPPLPRIPPAYEVDALPYHRDQRKQNSFRYTDDLIAELNRYPQIPYEIFNMHDLDDDIPSSPPSFDDDAQQDDSLQPQQQQQQQHKQHYNDDRPPSAAGLIQTFLCRMLPDAPHSCEYGRNLKDDGYYHHHSSSGVGIDISDDDDNDSDGGDATRRSNYTISSSSTGSSSSSSSPTNNNATTTTTTFNTTTTTTNNNSGAILIGIANPSESVFYEALALAAYGAGLITSDDNKTPRRHDVVLQIRQYHEVTLQKSPLDFPLQCPSSASSSSSTTSSTTTNTSNQSSLSSSLQGFLNLSLSLEEELVPEFAQRSKEEHIASFWKQALVQKKFCWIDTDKTLQDVIWQDFFRQIRRKQQK